jgi:hypothetical protein
MHSRRRGVPGPATHSRNAEQVLGRDAERHDYGWGGAICLNRTYRDSPRQAGCGLKHVHSNKKGLARVARTKAQSGRNCLEQYFDPAADSIEVAIVPAKGAERVDRPADVTCKLTRDARSDLSIGLVGRIGRSEHGQRRGRDLRRGNDTAVTEEIMLGRDIHEGAVERSPNRERKP